MPEPPSSRPSFLAIAGVAFGIVLAGLLVLGFLATVLLSAWEASRRAECLNHLRIIGQAVNSYYDLSADGPGLKSHYPRAAIPNGELSPDQRLSWLVDLLPYLEASGNRRHPQPLPAGLDKLALDQGWDAPANRQVAQDTIGTFLCPSHPGHDRARPCGPSDYVGISGIDPDSALLPRSDPRAGALGFDRLVTREQIGAGQSYTLLATETIVHNGCWLAAGEPTLRGLAPEENHYFGAGGEPFGGCHPHGANAVFLDGSARFISEKISPQVFRGMATLAGLEDRAN